VVIGLSIGKMDTAIMLGAAHPSSFVKEEIKRVSVSLPGKGGSSGQ
jgi:hypothetical protein